MHHSHVKYSVVSSLMLHGGTVLGLYNPAILRRSVGIKQLVFGGENRDWKVPEQEIPRVRRDSQSPLLFVEGLQ